ncbi:hypothetical protein M4I32_01265 [Microbacterium sp. LRZ72]|uniref:hypothetical protein n=1 Tax=Microbacterium sp. LRZ72 TaxID=2942481 RepID=UPI0029A5B6DE|nr:hypothetical protein [Microbacterium sp. LRZ72]MDX2375430.1 hypothetical protein [Microbacterium sp. LRZ72]
MTFAHNPRSAMVGIRSARTLVSLLTAVALAVMLLSGCASRVAGTVADAASATPEPTAADPGPSAVSGEGPTEFPGVDFAIPDEAASVVVEFECTGGGDFSVELGDSMMLGQAPVTGSCAGTQELSWPITAETGPTLYVVVPEGVEWVATPEFSASAFAEDEALTGECEQFSEVYSALVNADTGYTQYDAFDATEWASRVDAAAAGLETLAAEAPSMRAEAYAQIEQAVSDSGRTVGAALSPETQGPIGEIMRACNGNQTPVVIAAEFGG